MVYAGRTVSVDEILPDTMPGDLELAVLPTPQEADTRDSMVAVSKVAAVTPDVSALRAGARELRELFGENRVAFLEPGRDVPADCDTVLLIGGADRNPATRSHLEAIGESVPADKGSEAYLLDVRAGGDRHTIVLAGASPQGDYWALQSLKQMAVRKRGVIYLREATLHDWPVLPLRGSKRPKKWEAAYKANLRFGNGGSPAYLDVFMNAWVRDIHLGRTEVDPSEAFIDRIAATIADDTKLNGCIGYYLHLDDSAEKICATESARFDSYQAAVLHILKGFRQRLDAVDPRLKIFFMPNCYFYRELPGHSQMEPYSVAMRAAGGLPANTSLSFNGISITTDTYPPEVIARYQKAFGVEADRSLLYYYNDPKHFPGVIHKWSPELAEHILGIAAEAAAAVTRLGIYDWHWNPEAYDPDRALMLACRELCGRESWKRLYDVIRLHDDRFPGPECRTQTAAVAHYVQKAEALNEAYAALLADKYGVLRGRLALPETAVHAYPYEPIGSMAQAVKDAASPEYLEKIKTLAFREVRCPRIEGATAEATDAWAQASTADNFYWNLGGQGYGKLVTLQVYRDDTTLNLRISKRQRKLFDVDRGYEMIVQLDPGHTHEHCYEFRLWADNRAEDALYTRHTTPTPQGNAYESGWSHKVELSKRLWSTELSIPLDALPGNAEPGSVWGIRVFVQDGGSRNSYVWPLSLGTPGNTSLEGAGHLVFE